MSDYDELLGAVKELAAGLQALHRQAVEQLTPLVEGILRSRSRDVRHIEQTLDRLLDHCGYDPAVLLYRRLCRHYGEIDPVATVGYVNAYREIWDTPDEPSDEQPASVDAEQQVANACSCEPQGASRGSDREPCAAPPAASAVPILPCERNGASHRCSDGVVEAASPAASAVPLTAEPATRPAASAVPLTMPPGERQGASRRLERDPSAASPAANAVPLTEARP